MWFGYRRNDLDIGEIGGNHKMKSKKIYVKKEIILKDGTKQEYFIDSDPKAHIAQVREKRKIYVNKNFEKLPREDKLVTIYHERGHSKFLLFTLLSKFAVPIFGILALITFLSIIITGYKPIAIILFIDTILMFATYYLIFWLLEIIADANAIKAMGKKR